VREKLKFAEEKATPRKNQVRERHVSGHIERRFDSANQLEDESVHDGAMKFPARLKRGGFPKDTSARAC